LRWFLQKQDCFEDKMPDQPASMLDTERPRQKFDLSSVSRELMVKTGSSRFLVEWAKLNASQSRMTFDEYLAMRLWDPAFCPRLSLGEFMGNRGMEKVWATANFIPGSHALAANKIAAAALFSAYGLAVPKLTGLHALGVIPGPDRTATPQALEKFLLETLPYPAFGKPLSGMQSLGSISLDSCERSSGTLLRQDGVRIRADAFAREVHERYGRNGYMFQPRLVPHETVRAVCGERAATLRILTINGANGPKIFRACWKIPAGLNWADNFWRPGNLLASVDPDTGIIQRVVTGTGLAMTDVEKHPDTQTRLAGLKVPLWEERCTAALTGAAALPDFGLLGWDVAATAEGPVIVEVNDTPDAIISQIADRRGLMEPLFRQFLEERRQAQKTWLAELRAFNRREHASAGKIFQSSK
jgi:hypothetical protein